MKSLIEGVKTVSQATKNTITIHFKSLNPKSNAYIKKLKKGGFKKGEKSKKKQYGAYKIQNGG